MTPAKLRALVRAQVAETRTRQGLDVTITDPDALRELAVAVADVLAGAERDPAGSERARRGGAKTAPQAAKRATQTPGVRGGS